MPLKRAVVMGALALTLVPPVTGLTTATMLAQERTRTIARTEAEETRQAPPLAIPPGYRYETHGRRDPFVSPIQAPPETRVPVALQARPAGLRGVLLNEVQLVGVVSSGRKNASMDVAVMLAPGNRTFIARPGDELFDVVVREIRSDAVVFEVKSLDGTRGSREEVVRQLAATPGE